MSEVQHGLEEALAILRPSLDIVTERPTSAAPPEWAIRRGWTDFLLALDDAALTEAEHAPAAWLATHAPGALGAWARDALAFLRSSQWAAPQEGEMSHEWRFSADAKGTGRALGADGGEGATQESRETQGEHATMQERKSVPGVKHSAGGVGRRHVKARKHAQIAALLAVARELEGVERVVDLGSGHGHLTRAFGELVDAVGVERDRSRVARARDLGGRFVAGEGAEVTLRPEDLAVGLHPCGALGDDLVRGARRAGARVLMVSCCYQKTPLPERRWLAQRAAGFAVPQPALGLANLAPVSFRNSGSLTDKRRWRRTRLAVRLALAARGETLDPGDEARGVTKECFRRGLRPAADRAFGRRSLPRATAAELDAAAAEAARVHGRIARFALPRHALARILEFAIVLDRAAYLAEAGYRASVKPLFGLEVSPRNLAVVALPD